MLFFYTWSLAYEIIHLNVRTVTPKSTGDCLVNNAFPYPVCITF